MNKDMLTILDQVLYDTWAFWSWCAFLFLWNRERFKTAKFMQFVLHELKPFALPALVGSFFCDTILHPSDWLQYLFFAGNFAFAWYVIKNDDDDRWKRRRKKLAEKIRRTGAKLAVEPA